MVNAETARNIVGIIGNVMSFGLYLSPSPTFWQIIKRKSVEELQPFAYIAIATCMNCMFWMLYGLPFVHPKSTLVITINAIGLVMEFIYLSIFCYYDHQNQRRKKVAIGLSGEVVFVLIIAVTTMVAFHTHESRSFFVGIICDVFNIIMYASPLTIVKKVIRTKSVEYMPFYLSLAGFTNGCVWAAYALIKLDYFILISNGLGALFGLLQLIIYGVYYRSTPRTGQDIEKPPEVQLSTAPRA
ncbi:bidirectional sugar transporter SWEET6a-like [Mangifera indica]|uniref:bidirectional sugar transporter SWEET6a-like n=2 Tax=Mangifera indica TaxID=29780 RepID=UPI001CFAFA12|nr:bidirectional sugar transporter SWEET6a-like [Mangifera indica]XP_044504018.1 bidirectional sugar transporter SWEET6a-like [Mangifera indica]XP_044504044.1 bidirectional sugar transporter SWEET6a-like [Mangifera indica]XP_044504045.1 bidirectional sugar transporter SWEET6a-like [Mangifera indica]